MGCQQEKHHWHQRQKLPVAGVLHSVIQLLPEGHPVILPLQCSIVFLVQCFQGTALSPAKQRLDGLRCAMNLWTLPLYPGELLLREEQGRGHGHDIMPYLPKCPCPALAAKRWLASSLHRLTRPAVLLRSGGCCCHVSAQPDKSHLIHLHGRALVPVQQVVCDHAMPQVHKCPGEAAVHEQACQQPSQDDESHNEGPGAGSIDPLHILVGGDLPPAGSASFTPGARLSFVSSPRALQGAQ